MDIVFTKMHGAGNDFIMVDDRDLKFPADHREWLAAVGARRTGVGCDGFILIQPSVTADFRMRFFNPDGGEAEMCGNGARCAALFAYDRELAPLSMSIETNAGQLHAYILDDRRIRLQLTDPADWRMNIELNVENTIHRVHHVDTGVPHAVMEVDDLEKLDINLLGPAIRGHDAFAPAGANANFVLVDSPSHLKLRTYERGVEAETLACGTGMVAAALVAARLGRVRAPVSITCASSDNLEVDYRGGNDGFHDIALTGPAAYVFNGSLPHPK